MNIPQPIADYLAAANAGNGRSAAACFSENATVLDEGVEHRGRRAIREWVEDTMRKYRPRLEPLRLSESGDRLVITCRVSGDFPGSPVGLDFHFALADDAIASLRVE